MSCALIKNPAQKCGHAKSSTPNNVQCVKGVNYERTWAVPMLFFSVCL